LLRGLLFPLRVSKNEGNEANGSELPATRHEWRKMRKETKDEGGEAKLKDLQVSCEADWTGETEE